MSAGTMEMRASVVTLPRAAGRSSVPAGGRSARPGDGVRAGTAGPAAASRLMRSGPATLEPRLRLTRRGRLTVTVLVAAVAVVLALVGARTASAGSTSQSTGTELVTVLPGDTLWSIAAEHAPAVDIRDGIAQIRSLNDLETSALMVGQELVVPVP